MQPLVECLLEVDAEEDAARQSIEQEYNNAVHLLRKYRRDNILQPEKLVHRKSCGFLPQLDGASSPPTTPQAGRTRSQKSMISDQDKEHLMKSTRRTDTEVHLLRTRVIELAQLNEELQEELTQLRSTPAVDAVVQTEPVLHHASTQTLSIDDQLNAEAYLKGCTLVVSLMEEVQQLTVCVAQEHKETLMNRLLTKQVCTATQEAYQQAKQQEEAAQDMLRHAELTTETARTQEAHIQQMLEVISKDKSELQQKGQQLEQRQHELDVSNSQHNVARAELKELQKTLADSDKQLKDDKVALEQQKTRVQQNLQQREFKVSKREKEVGLREKELDVILAREEQVTQREGDVNTQLSLLAAKETQLQQKLSQMSTKLEELATKQRDIDQYEDEIQKREIDMANWMKEMEWRELQCEDWEDFCAHKAPPIVHNNHKKSKKTVVERSNFNESMLDVQIHKLKHSYLSGKHRQYIKTHTLKEELPKLALRKVDLMTESEEKHELQLLQQQVKERCKLMRKLQAKMKVAETAAGSPNSSSTNSTSSDPSCCVGEGRLLSTKQYRELESHLDTEKALKNDGGFLGELMTGCPLDVGHLYPKAEYLVTETTTWWCEWKARLELRLRALLEKRQENLTHIIDMLESTKANHPQLFSESDGSLRLSSLNMSIASNEGSVLLACPNHSKIRGDKPRYARSASASPTLVSPYQTSPKHSRSKRIQRPTQPHA
eukprot:TRINITY_DN62581_c0_g1_i1.p1 TRINITY_DN62581_c0_g1~~TRINITY_DN62581_c0_g1_i1.p1  ORF type:complete len:719 (+),score=85.28 TRINITY_DN62581_c0_g1_i1:113-2269(+)